MYAVLILATTNCRSLNQQVTTTKNETVAQKSLQKYDSVLIRDSVMMLVYHDTIYKERWHNEIRYKYQDRWRDSIHIVKDTVLQVVNVPQAVTKSNGFRSKLGSIVLCILFAAAALGIVTVVQKYKSLWH